MFIFGQVPALAVLISKHVDYDQDTDKSDRQDQGVAAIASLAACQRLARPIRKDECRQANDDHSQADLQGQIPGALHDIQAGRNHGSQNSHIQAERSIAFQRLPVH